MEGFDVGLLELLGENDNGKVFCYCSLNTDRIVDIKQITNQNVYKGVHSFIIKEVALGVDMGSANPKNPFYTDVKMTGWFGCSGYFFLHRVKPDEVGSSIGLTTLGTDEPEQNRTKLPQCKQWKRGKPKS